MSRSIVLRFLVRVLVRSTLVVAASSMSATAFAQTPPKGLEALPDIPPPPRLSGTPGAADDEDNPQITIKQGEGGTKIEEFRTRGGKLYAVRVTPSIGKPYLLVDPDGTGSVTSSGDLGIGSTGVRTAQWTIFEF
jgi:hypothetical protein